MSEPVVRIAQSALERLRKAALSARRAPLVQARRPEPANSAVVPAAEMSQAAPEPIRPSSQLGSSSPVLPSKAQNDLFKAPPKAAAKPTKKAARAPLSAQASREKTLKALGFASIGEALLCVPSQYIDCRMPITSLLGLGDGCRGLFLLRKTGAVEALDQDKKRVASAPHDSIWDAPYQGYWSRIRQLRIELTDETGRTVWMSLFNPWRQRGLPHEGPVLVDGVLKEFGPRLYMTEATEPPVESAGRVWVRYVCPGAPSEEDVLRLVREAASQPDSHEVAAHALVASTLLSESQLLDVAEEACGQRYASLQEFFQCLHEPESPIDGDLAASAARFMAVAGICSAAKAANTRLAHPKAPVPVPAAMVGELIAAQSETLTSDQLQVVNGLVEAVRSPQPLTGLLSGDVGTGKTLAFLIPAVAVHLCKRPVAIVSPTEILANQVAANLIRRFPMAKVERVVAGGRIRDPEAILVGTSGLATVAKKAGYVPSLLVIDEQHKLATKDRNSMLGPWTHQLEASATPIPRSLASTLFSGTKVFNLSQAPVARRIESSVLGEAERDTAVAWMREALAAGQRIAIIYPRVEKGGKEGQMVSNVADAAAALEQRFPGKVGMLHGKMPTEALMESMAAFRSGVTPIVVASTIMETGIDIPDIRLLIVKDADNFGIAQLHQLRGRLARNGGAGRFVMMVQDLGCMPPETASRLSTVQRVADGYALAEADMQTRGFGDLAGLAQTGGSACAFRLLRLGLADFEGQ